MAKLDPFSDQIVQLVRKMPDEAILALVRGQLGVETSEPLPVVTAGPKRARKTRAKSKAKAVAAKPSTARATRKTAGRPKKRTSAARLKVLSAVERAVKSAKGLSASEVARTTGIGQVRVATALRDLKKGRRIYQGGDRRFARYAGDRKTADAASVYARQNAAGPVTKKRARRTTKRKKR